MCQNKCPSCNEKLSFMSVFSNAMFSVTQDPIKCEKCHVNVKPNFSKSIAVAMLPQLLIIPVMNMFNFSVLETILYATAHIFVSAFLLICFTSFTVQDSEADQNNENT